MPHSKPETITRAAGLSLSPALSLIFLACFINLAVARAQSCASIGSPSHLTGNAVPIGSATCAVSNSGVSSDASGTINTTGTVNAGSMNLLPPTYSGAPPNGIGLVSVTLLNSSAAAPAVNQLACWDPSVAATVTACNASTSRTSVVGVAFSNTVSVSGILYSQIVRMGSINCVFDNATTAGHYVVTTCLATYYKKGSHLDEK